MRKRLLGLSSLLGLILTSALAAQTTRIMPLGDSITQGIGAGKTGFRKYLWNQLFPPYNVDLVGTLQDGDGTFDPDHEGHPGWNAAQIRGNISNWIALAHPDIVLFHIGTNDISQARSTQAIIDDIDATLSLIWEHNFDIRVFLCAIVPRRDSLNTTTQELNSAIVSEIQYRRNTFTNRIYFVDEYSTIANVEGWETTLMDDNLHPNYAGYELMANTFYNAILPYVSPSVPVELASFSAKAVDDGVLLSWTTASETDNLGFAIEHRFADASFVQIGFVAGHGTSSSQHVYSFFHQVGRSGRHIYRLRQIDTDGDFELSDSVAALVAAPQQMALQASYPNPFSPQKYPAGTRIPFEMSATEHVSLKVFDVRGRIVAELIDGEEPPGRHVVTWDGRSGSGELVPTGTYFLRLQSPRVSRVERLQIVR